MLQTIRELKAGSIENWILKSVKNKLKQVKKKKIINSTFQTIIDPNRHQSRFPNQCKALEHPRDHTEAQTPAKSTRHQIL